MYYIILNSIDREVNAASLVEGSHSVGSIPGKDSSLPEAVEAIDID